MYRHHLGWLMMSPSTCWESTKCKGVTINFPTSISFHGLIFSATRPLSNRMNRVSIKALRVARSGYQEYMQSIYSSRNPLLFTKTTPFSSNSHILNPPKREESRLLLPPTPHHTSRNKPQRRHRPLQLRNPLITSRSGSGILSGSSLGAFLSTRTRISLGYGSLTIP